MRSKILSIALLGMFAIVLTSWTSMNTGATTTNFNFTVPFVYSDFVPCTGETVDFEGMIHVHGSTTITPNGSAHVNYHENLQGVSGIGQTTGNSYNYVGAFHQNFNVNVGETFSESFNAKVVSNGTQMNHKHNYHFTVNANGDVVVDFQTHGFTCSDD